MFTQEYIEEPDIERGQSDTISVKEELRECFGETGDVYLDGKKTSGSGSQVSMPTQANVGDGMQSSSFLRGLQWSLTDSSEIMRLVVDNPVGVQRETVEMMTARVQTDENDDAGERRAHHADSSLEAQCQFPAVGHETGYDEDVTVITHQVGSSFEAEHEARCDGDVHPKGTDGPLETTHTDEAASSESSEATVEPGQEASDREDSESDAPYTPELDIVFDALVELAGDGRCWVPVRQIQAQTSLQLWRLEELLEEWECMGVICRGDMRRNVAFGSSVADALEDEY